MNGRHLSIRSSMGWWREKVSADRLIFHPVFGSVSSTRCTFKRLLRLKQFSSCSDDVFSFFLSFLLLSLHFLPLVKNPSPRYNLSCLPSIIQKRKRKNIYIKRKNVKNWERESWYDRPNLCVGASSVLAQYGFSWHEHQIPREYSCRDEMCFYGDLGSGREIWVLPIVKNVQC